MSGPRVATTEQLRARPAGLPGLAPELSTRLHPHGRHLVYETDQYGDETAEDVTVCTVVAVSVAGEPMRFAHLMSDGAYRSLPVIEALLVEHTRLLEARLASDTIGEIEAWMARGCWSQEKLPFEEG